MQSETWDAELDSTCNQVGRYLCCGSLATWRRARRGMSIHTSTLDLPCVAWRLTQLWLPCHDQRVVCYVADTSCRCETASVMALMCDVASCRTMQICIRTKQFGTHAWLSVARCCSSLPYHLMSTLASFPVGSWTVYTFKYASQLPQRVWWLAMLTCFIVTTGAWYAPMLEGVNVIGPGAVFFFLVVVIIGTYVMMNLLVTVLLQLFATGGDDEAEESEIKSKIRSRPSSPDSIASRPGSRMGSRASSPVPFEDLKGSRLSAEEAEDRRRIRASHEEVLSHLDHNAPAVLAPDDLALGCLPPNNEFRMRCKQIVEHTSTDTLLI